ncbi:uncharacterized protein L3040_005060 [Drepanopeziza brunnea f. sp. 'multigermtubi']|uniref:Beta-xylanase n=1 Tax=Marssonina brunnea f. sp. multigermtubi (strain MB_m1) TaxID=1072389 RepID=K1WY01_MARBU|nr:glycoside hydrolase family 10 protein [Drepanopeziza brunnea f. sp. 'multigermtubi' MB_m1]EKD17457.1 glycoside hydrolase family 10 protein [Drepanopeziza brunnea f. sp. 'multigermtubi' MB_m1]KAJ5042517.1 hypothetical protein L3040_005060 [Drepanopeziza brunnea f. sp. 'multigermtubi']
MLSTTLILPFLLPAAHAQLNTLAIAAGLKYFGSATDNHELDDAPYVAILSDTTEFSMITVGNAQKWDTIGKSQDGFSFENADQIANLVAGNGQTLRCHTLVWYNQLPSWVSQGTWTRETLQKVLVDHITGVVTQYKGQCYAWDVVNEAFDDTEAAAHRDSPFYKAMGEDYIKIAFETARAADPDTKLYYNDYNIEFDGSKQQAALALVTQMVNEGTPIDGVGAQGHYISGKMPSTENIVANFEKYAALGLEVAITELDIRIELPGTPDKLEQQALDYAEAIKTCLDASACIGITIWDYTDKYSWVDATFQGYGQALLWDADLQKKPAYDAVAQVFSSRANNGSTPDPITPDPTTPDPTTPDPTTPEKKPDTGSRFTTSYGSAPTNPPTNGYPVNPRPGYDLPVESGKERPYKEDETETPTKKEGEKGTPTKEGEKGTPSNAPSKQGEKESPYKQNEKETSKKEGETGNPSKEGEKESQYKENETPTKKEGEKETSTKEGETGTPSNTPSKKGEKESSYKQNEKETSKKEGETGNPSKEGEKESPYKQNEKETSKKEGETGNPSKEGEKESQYKQNEKESSKNEGETGNPSKEGEKESSYKQNEKETSKKEGEKETSKKEGEKESQYKENEKETSKKEGEKETSKKEGETGTPSKEGEKESSYKQNEKEGSKNEGETGNPSKEKDQESPYKQDESQTPTKTEGETGTPTKEGGETGTPSNAPSKQGEKESSYRQDDQGTPIKKGGGSGEACT